MKKDEIVTFNVAKKLRHIKPLGAGGTGDTYLFYDETTEMNFAIKKYSPKNLDFIEDNYRRFVDEIKILFQISHPNIVRIYNYYLYPESNTGYLQMEYIDGKAIDEFEPDGWGKTWEDIFKELIFAFYYLESKGILHRDIRPSNIMIDNNESVKIIDFGFGKKVDSYIKQGSNSILLNWPVSEYPEEISLAGIYNHQTEIFFIGKLFSKILNGNLATFKYKHVITKMVKILREERYQSFEEITNDIINDVLSEIDFSDKDKEDYQYFVNELTDHISYYHNNQYDINTDFNSIIDSLAEVIRDNALEDSIQDNSKLIRCFVNGMYTYKPRKDIPTLCVIDFYKFITGLDKSKQTIALNNLISRLSKIKVVITDDDDIPF